MFSDEFAPETEIQHEEVYVDDNFPKGKIDKFFPNQGYGFIQDRNGRQVYFTLTEIEFVGTKGKPDIREGITVGYDLVHSGNGLHVKMLKIY